MSFKRHLEPEFIATLNELRDDAGSWWSRLVGDPDVFIAIRDNSINAYYGGASLARIDWNGSRPKFSVNRKYLVFPAQTGTVDLLGKGNELSVTATVVNDATKFAKHFKSIKTTAQRLQGEERIGENEIAVACHSVLDIEAAFCRESDAHEGRTDLVAVDGEGRVTLVEAKLYTNADLRSRDTTPQGRSPKVCTQLLEYYEWAMREPPEIIKAYSKVCNYRRDLGLANAPHLPAAAPFGLNPVPRLLIFGFDRAQQKQFDSTAIERGITIPGFAREHIRTLGSPRSVNDTHLE